MGTFDVQVKGLDKLQAKLLKMAKRLPEAAEQGVTRAAEETWAVAVRMARSRKLKNLIKTETLYSPDGKFVDYGRDNKVVGARVYNDTSQPDGLSEVGTGWSSYVEFGTGFYVDENVPPEAIVLKRAKTIPWYVPVWKVSADFGKYGYPRVGNYWEVDGMQPRPYMRPAGFQRREANRECVVDAVHDMLVEVSK